MRRAIVAAVGLCIAAFILLSITVHSPAMAQSPSATPIPTTASLTCQNIVSHALDVLQNTCDATGRNNACYGNASIQAQLTSADFSFQNPGDKVPVKAIKTVTTSPLDQNAGTWGLSLFKLQANLPDTLPGQNVTFLVYGNTSVQNVSGDMKAFYFSTGLGAPSCSAVPDDSILVRSPDHEQVTFTANGVKITIASTVRLRAVPNQAMTVELLEGHATVSTRAGSRVLQPSQSVSIPLGGATGLEPQGLASAPADMTLDMKTLGMVSSLNTLTNSNVSIPIKGCVTAVDGNDITIGDIPIQPSASDTTSNTANVGDCVTVNADVQTDSSGNVVVTRDTQNSSSTADNGGTTTSGSGTTTSTTGCPPATGPAGNPGGPKPPAGPTGNPPAGPKSPAGGPGAAGCGNAKPAGGPGGPKSPGGPGKPKPGGPKPPAGGPKPPAGPAGGPPPKPGGPGGKKP